MGNFIDTLSDSDSDVDPYNVVWLDYCCTPSGDKSKNIHPWEHDIPEIFKNNMLSKGGVFGVTFSYRDPHGKRRDYVLKELPVLAKKYHYNLEQINYHSIKSVYTLFYKVS